MKEFLKTMLRGIRSVIWSFAAVAWMTAGIAILTVISSYSGYKAILWFVGSLLSIAIGILGLWCLGYKEE